VSLTLVANWKKSSIRKIEEEEEIEGNVWTIETS
jgi:hypothetical protein